MVRIVKRTDLTKRQSVMFRLLAILGALLAAGIFILFLGFNPFRVYLSMLDGSFGSLYRFKESIIQAIPLIVSSLGISIAFRMKFWNIGAEGQIIMGAFAASYFALYWSNLPVYVMLPLMFLASAAAGGIWALIPAFFKAQFGTNETLFTLMMNYIAQKIIVYVQYGPWKDPKALGAGKIALFGDNAALPEVFGIHIGWIITVVLVILVYIFINKTKRGYEIQVIGESENTARYAGMNVKKIILSSLILSGALCGLVGMFQVSGVNHTLSYQVANGVGFTAIITTWLAGLSAPVIVIVCFLFAVLQQGGTFIQTAFSIHSSAAQLIQGMILFFVLGSEFFIQYRLVLKQKTDKLIKKEAA
ncbi:ABC transporter permease [Ruminiclostridium cellobioparum]|uniref:ABC transporter permease n=1 Tax=Ruminiclostridium cellobioparum TaxID=29355 RepID=UPI000483B310|nr:ABC transporter permease [Ruminiclostridium cellobioparum]